MIDMAQLRLQYEILNIPLSQLAKDNGFETSLSLFKEQVEELGWTQWWPEADLEIGPNYILDVAAGETKDDVMAMQAEQFIDKSKRRLAVYNVAKEILLAQRYFKLETIIVDKAIEALENTETLDPRSIQTLSTLYKNMTANSISQALQSISFSEDATGMPTVIIRDLSGRKSTSIAS